MHHNWHIMSSTSEDYRRHELMEKVGDGIGGRNKRSVVYLTRSKRYIAMFSAAEEEGELKGTSD